MLLQLPQGIFRMGIVVGEVDAGIGIEVEVEVLLGIVVVVEFSMIGKLDPDIVVDFDDDAVPMTVENARPTCPV